MLFQKKLTLKNSISDSEEDKIFNKNIELQDFKQTKNKDFIINLDENND